MSRSTQFIGLPTRATEFIESLEELESDTQTFGMFGETIPLRRWKYGDRDTPCIREIVQATPWSSGPMIFTCLEIDFGNGGTSGKVLQWIQDPRVTREISEDYNSMWV